MAAEQFADNTLDPPVRGFLHRTENATACLILTHGAGSNCQSPLLVAIAEAFAEAGFTVLRCNLPFRQNRSYGPPRPGDAERDRQGIRNAVMALEQFSGKRIFLGGHSYGGRQSTMLCADDPSVGNGSLLLSYPLHPPRKPEQLRVQHLPKLQTPALFVHGSRDPFGTVEEVESALRIIPGKTKLLVIEGAGHDLDFKGKSTSAEVPRRVLAAFNELFA